MNPNELERHNQNRRGEIEVVRDALRTWHAARPHAHLATWPLQALIEQIGAALSAAWGQGTLEPLAEIVERDRHGCDIALRFPQLLKQGGPKAFIANHLPWIVETLSAAPFDQAFARIDVKGMYINVTLSDRWLLDSAQSVIDAGADFGRNAALIDRRFLVDYSSPNVAKTLHAGHVRSTIIGHVLCNIYEACGALVYRINHINDFGGFGFILEGYRRFERELARYDKPNDRLLEIYRIRRVAERALADAKGYDGLVEDDRALIARYFPEATSIELLRAAFGDFTATADARFAALERGAADEVTLWRDLVAVSLADFDGFYDTLQVQIDLVIGESFYFAEGDRLVDRFLADGTAIAFGDDDARAEIARIDARLAREEIAAAERDSLAALAEKDVGAVVIPIDQGDRFVVRRRDGRSIYATRDIGAVGLRRDIFDPTDLVYVVGQEQQVHFDRLFRACAATGLADPARIGFRHIYFGFYVDADTGRKLSSRDSVASVNELLRSSIRYFRSRVGDRGTGDEAELDQAARELAIGSLVFNDLKQDVKGAVDIAVSDMDAMIARFERSGAAYVVYAACRARSILRRYDRAPTPASQIAEFEIDDQEALLLLKLQQIPQKVVASAEQANPSLLVRHLLDVATVYNSYYTRAPVLIDGVANPSRLLITAAVQQALINGLLLCHVSCPDAI